jgi:predicted nucleic acid-binding protein
MQLLCKLSDLDMCRACSYYWYTADAMYIALAEALPAMLFTCDGKLARAHGHRAHAELLT